MHSMMLKRKLTVTEEHQHDEVDTVDHSTTVDSCQLSIDYVIQNLFSPPCASMAMYITSFQSSPVRI